jgi:hypothetical protein
VAGFIDSLKPAAMTTLIGTFIALGVGVMALATGGIEVTVSFPHPVIPTNSNAAKNPVIRSLRVPICISIPSHPTHQLMKE